MFSFPDLVCIDIIEIWFRIAIGQILIIFDRAIFFKFLLNVRFENRTYCVTGSGVRP